MFIGRKRMPMKLWSGERGGGCTALKSIRVIAYGTCWFLCCVVWYVLVLRFLECGVLLVQIKSFFVQVLHTDVELVYVFSKDHCLNTLLHLLAISEVFQSLSGSCADFCLWLLSYSMREADLFLRVPLVHV